MSRTGVVQPAPGNQHSTNVKERKKYAHSEPVCLYQNNSSTLQIIRMECLKIKKKRFQRKSKLQDRAPNKLGSKST